MMDLQRFALPSAAPAGDSLDVALALLNTVKVSEDQLRYGCGILITADADDRASVFERLWTYVRSENLYPPDVAVEAIAIRAGWLRDFVMLGSDPEIEWDYARFASSPISLADLGIAGPEEDEDDDDEIPW